MHEKLLSELRQFVVAMEQKEATVKYTIPDEVIKTVRRAKSLEKLLLEIFTQVSGYGGIDLIPIIRREFGIHSDLMDHFRQWLPYSKEQLEDELHDAIDRAEIRAGNQGVFFAGTPSKQESTEALQLLKDIAHAAVRTQFHGELIGPEIYVEMMEKLLQFYELEHTYPEGDAISYRTLISADRLHAMSGEDDTITDAMKAYVKGWYQQSSHTFLESRAGYFSYEYVHFFLYVLTEEQVERLRSDYIQHIQDEFKVLKAKPKLDHAKKLEAMLEEVLSWTLCRK